MSKKVKTQSKIKITESAIKTLAALIFEHIEQKALKPTGEADEKE